jgi:hypothetical protein
MYVSKRTILLSMFVAFALFGSTWVFAHGDEIHACVDPKGSVRIVHEPESCKPKEWPLSWSQQGPEGPQGPQGEPGGAVKADPPCFDNANRYVDCGNGTVTDTVTGLIWLKDANCFGQLTYADANNAAAGLKDGDCGLTDSSSPGDWRLLTKAEWEATVDHAVFLACTNPSLTDTAGTGCFSAGTQPFTGVQSGYYWSSTTVAHAPATAWIVTLFGGGVGHFLKPSTWLWGGARGGCLLFTYLCGCRG